MLPPRQGAWQAALAALALVASAPRPVRADSYADFAAVAINATNRDFYSSTTGIWDDAWWNSANVVTVMAEFALLDNRRANDLNIGGYIRQTFIQAQKTNVQTVKAMKAGVVTSTYCLDHRNGCMSKREFLGKRGFDDFINEFYDDEGWWALAWIRAYDVSRDPEYLQAAKDIFVDMRTGTNTPCGGGIFWNKDRKYVNAITNELYLSVAASLANRAANPNERGMYLGIARALWDWFSRSGMINPQNLVNDGLDAGCRNNRLQTWTYNQGVILGGLTELFHATGGSDRGLLRRAEDIAEAAIRTLANRDQILVEADNCEQKDGFCGKDGQQFKGIFVRNLRYLNDAVRRPDFRAFILRNADSIWARDRSGDRLGVSWTGPFKASTGPSQSSAIDALVAAMAMS